MEIQITLNGKIIKETLSALEISKTQLYDLIKKKKLCADEIFLMTVDRNGKTFAVKRSDTL